MTTFVYIPEGLKQAWACISWLFVYLEMIKAQFPIGQYFIGIDIIKEIEKTSYQETSPPP